MDHNNPADRRAYACDRVTDAHSLIKTLVADCAHHTPMPDLPSPVTAEAIDAQIAYAATLAATTSRTECTCGNTFYLGSDVPRVAGERYAAFLATVRSYPRRPDTLPDVRRATWEVAVWTQRGGKYPVKPDFATHEPLPLPPASSERP
jgi:hypothetical protein